MAAIPAVALALLAAPVLPAQTGETSGVVEGRVQESATGRYFENARITVLNTNRQVFTNGAGEFRISNLPAGEVQLRAFYSGFEPQTITVQVEPGRTVRQDFSLALPGAAATGTVVMDEFVVASRREYNAQAIAINEQRFSPNIRNVVSTDAFGQINQGNIGDFLKHVPGVTVELKDGNTPSGIQVRGFNSNYTNVTLDGGQLASAALANTQNHSRQFVLEQASINNLSRIEVVKLPTPDMSANSLGGSVNFVSKSAFEREKPELRYSAYFSANSEAIKLDKSPGAGRDEDYTILPSFDATYVLPVNDSFGLVASVAQSSQFYLVHQSVPLHRWTEDGATVDNPFTNEFRWSIAPNRTDRTSGSLKIDWKPGEKHLVEFSAQATAFKQKSASRTETYRITGTPAEWGETFTHGAEGEAGGSIGTSTQERHGLTRALQAKYTFSGDPWTIELAADYSHSNNRTRDIGKGFFRGMSTNLQGVSRIDFDDIGNDNGSARVTLYDEDGNVVDPTDLSLFNVTRVQGEPMDAEDTLKEARLNVRYDFHGLSFPLSLQAGGSVNHLQREIDYELVGWDYVGPDGETNTDDDRLTAYADPRFSGTSPGYGRPGREWASPWLVYDALQEHPEWFLRSEDRIVDSIANHARRSPLLREMISAGYVMADAKFFQNRLRVVGGFRYELTEDEGWGMKDDSEVRYLHDANGNVVRDEDGNAVPNPDVPAGSAREAELRYTYRGNYNSRDYDGVYPSLHTTFNITDSLLFRAAYAKTIGRPRLVDIVPVLSVSTNESPTEQSPYPGFISSSNTSLLPWEADNYDFSLEYYLPRNGVVSISYFRKDISNFFGSLSQVADEALLAELGLPDDYLGYRYSTRINVGDARIKGWEFNYMQTLDFLGEWGRNITVFGNLTKLQLSGERTADFTDFIPRARNLGVRFSIGRFSVFGKWNYRGKQLREEKDDYPGAAEFIRARNQIDAEVEYRLSDRFAIFLAGQNITNETNEWEVSGPVAPSWSFLQSHSTFGAQYSLGVRGTF